MFIVQRHKRNTNNILLQTVTTFEQAYAIQVYVQLQPLSTEPYSLTTFSQLIKTFTLTFFSDAVTAVLYTRALTTFSQKLL